MLHEFVTAHPLLVQIVCFMLPMLVMMFGPSDAAVRRHASCITVGYKT